MDVVYALIPVGVSEQAPAGVFSTRRRATAAAKKLWKRSDGYHIFEIHEMEIDVTYDSFSRGGNYTYRAVPPEKPLPEPTRVTPKVLA